MKFCEFIKFLGCMSVMCKFSVAPGSCAKIDVHVCSVRWRKRAGLRAEPVKIISIVAPRDRSGIKENEAERHSEKGTGEWADKRSRPKNGPT